MTIRARVEDARTGRGLFDETLVYTDPGAKGSFYFTADRLSYEQAISPGPRCLPIEEYCGGMQDGHRFYAYLPGGASGGILPASMGDIPLDFDTLQPHGCFIGSAAVMILSEQDRATDAARNMMKFFSEESCGQCTPCRVGTAKALKLIEQPRWNQALLAELSQVMIDASICGLGQAAPNPVLSVMKYFPHELA